MDLTKKRKADENGASYPANDVVPQTLTPDDVRKILDPFTKEQLVDILASAVANSPSPAVLDSIRSVADADPTHRKLFVRGIGWETTSEKLRAVFSGFGELEEAIVITDKLSGKSKGYGFVTFRHIDGAVLALKEPSKKIDGRITVAQLASARDANNVDVSMRKVYVGNVPFEVSSDRLLSVFSAFGEIEEGPLGFDKQSGKQKGFAFFVYKTEEGARASLVEPNKVVDGHPVICKFATDGKKGKVGGPGGDGLPMQQQIPGQMPGQLNSSYGGLNSFGGYTVGPPALPHQNTGLNSPLPSAISGQGYGNQGPLPFGGPGTGGYGSGPVGGYGSGVAGGYGSGSAGGYGTGATGGYGSGGYGVGAQYGGSVSGEFSGVTNFGSSGNRMPQPGGFPDGGNYGLSSSYPSQMNQPLSGPRAGPGGAYQGMPPY